MRIEFFENCSNCPGEISVGRLEWNRKADQNSTLHFPNFTDAGQHSRPYLELRFHPAIFSGDRKVVTPRRAVTLI